MQGNDITAKEALTSKVINVNGTGNVDLKGNVTGTGAVTLNGDESLLMKGAVEHIIL